MNIISGLYQPSVGSVNYIGLDSGSKYSSLSFRPKIGYVPQDIYFFKGSIRDNLVSGEEHDESLVWDVLDKVFASSFVRELGGLDVESSEAGRSLSGGQRRRLAIAKVLLAGCDVLLFDEVTSGLDDFNRKGVIDLIKSISKDKITIVISHDITNNADFHTLCLN